MTTSSDDDMSKTFDRPTDRERQTGMEEARTNETLGALKNVITLRAHTDTRALHFATYIYI